MIANDGADTQRGHQPAADLVVADNVVTALSAKRFARVNSYAPLLTRRQPPFLLNHRCRGDYGI